MSLDQQIGQAIPNDVISKSKAQDGLGQALVTRLQLSDFLGISLYSMWNKQTTQRKTQQL